MHSKWLGFLLVLAGMLFVAVALWTPTRTFVSGERGVPTLEDATYHVTATALPEEDDRAFCARNE